MTRHHRSGHMRYLNKSLLGTLLILSAQAGFAATINITTNQIITTPTQYNGDTLNMSAGFVIMPGGSLDITNCTVNVQASSSNPFFTHMTAGHLMMKDNTVNVSAGSITPTPGLSPSYQLIMADQGTVDIDHNFFAVNQANTYGFLKTGHTYATSNFKVTQNVIKNFHGGLYLLNNFVAQVEDNAFWNMSLSNVLIQGTSSNIRHNTFSFPGNLSVGSALDVINSANIEITDNFIASSASYGIHIVGGEKIKIKNNKIADGLSYGISIEAPVESVFAKYRQLQALGLKPIRTAHGALVIGNKDISIRGNYVGQNRYGLSADQVSRLIVRKNTFLQKFKNAATRKYWTDNQHLLTDVTNLEWTDNLYKEAYTQEVPGDNTLANHFAVFPETGGVEL